MIELIQSGKLAPLVTLTGLALTAVIAYATYRTFRLQQQLLALSKPTMADLRLVKGHETGEPYNVTFAVDDNHATAWHINSVYTKPVWRQTLSEVGSIEYDTHGGVARYFPKAWVRSIIYDPPVRRASVLLRPDCPDAVVIVFRLEMKASPKTQSACAVRLRVRH